MHCKSYSHFFSKKFQRIYVSLDVNFNELLPNNVVSFEQLGPDLLNVNFAYQDHMVQFVHSPGVGRAGQADRSGFFFEHNTHI